ncbi:Ig-like domain-containing protein [Vibrio sp. SCSIO 43140]|uniref:VolA/Pla-1 family phospholipase n=1 Tax=Vibrio sp. SCSIO 43140 TaxID=2819100 RepID=UPI0020763DCA|nr:VolA/Pla-1 family phospholipase [Vibrio sp. SCSIO 43140]USD63724.1 Ig-like domain-containing protein [Vibrio sp. SCSIO 43140]
MKKTYLATALSGVLLLVGCGGDAEQSGEATLPTYESYITESLAQPTKLQFVLQGANATVPVPNNLLINTLDGTLEIPTGGDDALSNPLAAMGQMDGWSTTANLTIPFDGVLDAATAAASVTIIKLTEKLTGSPLPEKTLTHGVDYVVSTSGGNLIITPLVDFEASSEYIIAVTNNLKDSTSASVGMSQSYASLKSTSRIYESGSLASAQQLVQGVEALVQAGTGGAVAAQDIVYSAWFTTQSVGETLYATKAMLAQAQSDEYTYSTIWKEGANPNNAAVDTIGQMTFGDSDDFAVILAADDNFTKYISNETVRSFVISQYTTATPGTVTVTKGTVNLPYYLETGADWSTQPFESGSTSLAIVTNTITDNEAEQTHFAEQLVSYNIDPTEFFADPASKLQDILGLTFTKVDGSRYDTDRIITQYSPVPVVKSVEAVNFLLYTPTNPTGALDGLVIYQHGITSAKENSYFFANNLVANNYAVIAIDAPIHGERSLDDQRSANTNVLAYMNLSVLPVARDNIRQSMLDLITLRMALGTTQAAGGLTTTSLAVLPSLATTPPSFIGHSLGGILGVPTVAQANRTLNSAADAFFSFKNASFVNAGGQISNLLLGSESFGPVVTHNVALAAGIGYDSFVAGCGTPGETDYEKNCLEAFEADDPSNYSKLLSTNAQFGFAAQTVLDTADPYTNATVLKDLATPVYMGQVLSDATVPNNVPGPMPGTTVSKYVLPSPLAGTEPLAAKLGLTDITASSGAGAKTTPFVRFNDVGQHSTFVFPQGTADAAHHAEMQTQVVTFVDANASVVTNTTVLE